MGTAFQAAFLLVVGMTACAIGGLAHAIGPAPSVSTDYVRELAKSKPSIFIVASGPATLRIAQTLESALVGHPEYKNGKDKRVFVTSLGGFAQESARDSKNQLDQASRLFLIATDELDGAIPGECLSRMDLDPGKFEGDGGRVVAKMLVEKAGAFGITAVAPDAQRVQKLVDALRGQSYDKRRNMSYSAAASPVHPSPNSPRAITRRWISLVPS